MGPYPGIGGSVVLVCIGVFVAKNDACGVSGNGLCKPTPLELGGSENDGICDTVLSSGLMLELVWKVELAADHESPEDSPEVSPGGSLEI
jgi:hypothetical protein